MEYAGTRDYGVGSRITYKTFGGGYRIVMVTAREADVKNGRPGFTGRVVGGEEDGLTVWGYDDQIVGY